MKLAAMKKESYSIPEQNPYVRIRNFEEIALGYSPDQAIEKAERCLLEWKR